MSNMRSGVDKDGLIVERGFFPKDALPTLAKSSKSSGKKKPATTKSSKKK